MEFKDSTEIRRLNTLLELWETKGFNWFLNDLEKERSGVKVSVFELKNKYKKRLDELNAGPLKQIELW